MLQTSVNERFKEIAERLYSGKISTMAVETGIPRTTLQDIINGKKSSPGYDIIRRIAEISAVKISLDWLILGVGEMLDSQESSTTITNNSHNIGSPINDSVVINKLLTQLEEKDRQLEQKSQEINRLLTLIEKK